MTNITNQSQSLESKITLINLPFIAQLKIAALILLGGATVAFSIIEMALPLFHTSPDFLTHAILFGVGLLLIYSGLLLKSYEVMILNFEKKLNDLGPELTHGLEGILKNTLSLFKIEAIESVRFTSTEAGVKYMADGIKNAKSKIYHASLSPRIPRHYESSEDLEKAVSIAASKTEIEYLYIANIIDEARKLRIGRLRHDPSAKNFMVRVLDPGKMAKHIMNFMVFDNKEVVLSIPALTGHSSIVLIRNDAVAKAFTEFFSMQWAEATEYKE
jgi:hypothetical protein